SAAMASSEVSRPLISAARSLAEGTFWPTGGIMPERSLSSTSSQIAGSVCRVSGSMPSSAKPQAKSLKLWQSVQYWSSRCHWALAGARGSDCAAAPAAKNAVRAMALRSLCDFTVFMLSVMRSCFMGSGTSASATRCVTADVRYVWQCAFVHLVQEQARIAPARVEVGGWLEGEEFLVAA